MFVIKTDIHVNIRVTYNELSHSCALFNEEAQIENDKLCDNFVMYVVVMYNHHFTVIG